MVLLIILITVIHNHWMEKNPIQQVFNFATATKFEEIITFKCFP